MEGRSRALLMLKYVDAVLPRSIGALLMLKYANVVLSRSI
jgi:hypothetical protein